MKNFNFKSCEVALIVGANGGIGLSSVKKLLAESSCKKIICTFRRKEYSEELIELANQNRDTIELVSLDITSEEDISVLEKRIKEQKITLDFVFCTTGLLHDGDLQPEKSLRQVNGDSFMKVMAVNAMGPFILAAKIHRYLSKEVSMMAFISAKVGSIDDNRMGGWYSYRSSKSALNMIVKNISIELKRSRPDSIVLSLHPGTTDTALSKPFSKNVQYTVYSPDQTIAHLWQVMEGKTNLDSGKFFSWNGEELPW